MAPAILQVKNEANHELSEFTREGHGHGSSGARTSQKVCRPRSSHFFHRQCRSCETSPRKFEPENTVAPQHGRTPPHRNTQIMAQGLARCFATATSAAVLGRRRFDTRDCPARDRKVIDCGIERNGHRHVDKAVERGEPYSAVNERDENLLFPRVNREEGSVVPARCQVTKELHLRLRPRPGAAVFFVLGLRAATRPAELPVCVPIEVHTPGIVTPAIVPTLF